mgnify:CR=1 FL=1
MAKQCRVCEKIIDMPRKCRFCGDRLCKEHMLPENHDCHGLSADVESDEPWFIDKSDNREDKPREDSIINQSGHGPESPLLSSDVESTEESTIEEPENSDSESAKQRNKVQQDSEGEEAESNKNESSEQHVDQDDENEKSHPVTSRMSDSQSTSKPKRKAKAKSKPSSSTSHSGMKWSKPGQQSKSGGGSIRRWLRFGWRRLKAFVTAILRLTGVASFYIGLVGVVWLLVSAGTASETILSLGMSALGIALLYLTQ